MVYLWLLKKSKHIERERYIYDIYVNDKICIYDNKKNWHIDRGQHYRVGILKRTCISCH